MLKFRMHDVVPPGGKYFYELNGVPVFGFTRTGMLQAVRDAAGAQGTTLPGDRELWAELEDFMCRRLPEGFCTGDAGGARARVATLPSVKAATEAVIGNGRHVTMVEATIRANRCLSCPKNNKSMCTSCVGINKWAAMKMGLREVPPRFRWLGICEADTVALVAKVLSPRPPVVPDLAEDCWIIKEFGDG